MNAAAPHPAVPSPCVNVCRMNEATGLCVGCHRTLDEIAQWSVLGDEAKRAVWLLLRERRLAAQVAAQPAAPPQSPGAST